MTIKNRFVLSGIWMLAVPIGVILLGGMGLLIWFFASSSSHIAYLFENFWGILDDPEFQKGALVWSVSSVFIILAAVVAAFIQLSASVLKPIGDLKQAANNIKDGMLDFEIMTARYDELNELCMAFDAMRKRLQEVELLQKEYENERSMLIANISHDLRTPITSIKGYVEGIMDDVADTPEKKREYLRTIYQKAEILEALVESMSEFSAFEMKRVHYEFKYEDIAPLLRDFAEDYRLDLESEGIELRCAVPEKPAVVMLDWNKMLRVLSNVVGNAVKYKKDGGGILEISLDERGGGVYLVITDNGRGIRADDIKRVFESHFRGDLSRTSQVEGHGLGLSIAKQIVETHRGKIWLQSAENVGTSVFIYLPLKT